MQADEEASTQLFLNGMFAISVDRDIARVAGLLLNERRRRGRPASVIDTMIAATALRLEVPLITNDIDYFGFPGLTVVPGR